MSNDERSTRRPLSLKGKPDAAARIEERLHKVLAQAGLGRDQVGDFLQARRDDGGRLVQNGRALEAREPGLVRVCLGVGLAYFIECGLGYAADLLAGVGVEDGDGAVAARANLLARDAHGVQRVVADVAADVTHDCHPGLDPGSMPH